MAVKADFGDAGWLILLEEDVVREAEKRFREERLRKCLGMLLLNRV